MISNIRPLLFILPLLLLSYSNTFDAAWQYDDFHNIIRNPRLHLETLTFQAIRDTFYGSLDQGYYKGESLYRPVAGFTFGVNWFFGEDNVFGYHIVNVAVHCITAWILYLTILQLCSVANFAREDYWKRHSVALMASLLWGIHPIQVQGVTYIVQRMASMAAMFSLLMIYFYLMARRSESAKTSLRFFIGCLASFLLALGSKENAILIPFSLVLLEILFFRRITAGRKKIFLALLLVALAIPIALIPILHQKGVLHFSFMDSYKIRPFTAYERVLTEPRILIFYLSQIFYPLSDRFSLQHDFDISLSLFQPISTVLAVAGILILVIFAIAKADKHPFLCLAIFFFFINHLVESTIVPLELAFEHRNYLPSFFLFLPFCSGFFILTERLRKSKLLYCALYGCFCLVIVLLGMSTYTRNTVWKTEYSLWNDVLRKSPEIVQPYINLSSFYAENNPSIARAFLDQALFKKSPNKRYTDALIFEKIAKTYLREDNLEETIRYCNKSIEVNEKFDPPRQTMISAFIKGGMWEKAHAMLDPLLERRPDKGDFLNKKGFLLMKQNKPREAVPYFTDAIPYYSRSKILKTNYWAPLFNLGLALDKIGYHDQANWFLTKAHEAAPKVMLPLFALIQNNLYLSNPERADYYIEELLSQFTVEHVTRTIKMLPESNIHLSVGLETIAPILTRRIDEYARNMTLPSLSRGAKEESDVFSLE